MILNQTVTVYRSDGTRQVLSNCYFTGRRGIYTDNRGTQRQDRFTLIVRGGADIRPGDRLMEGIGPEQVEWNSLLPHSGKVFRIDYVQPFFWGGKVSHMEAGGVQNRYG